MRLVSLVKSSFKRSLFIRVTTRMSRAALHTTNRHQNIWDSFKKDKQDLLSQILPPKKYLNDLIRDNKLSCSPDDVEAIYRLAGESIQQKVTESPRDEKEIIKDLEKTDEELLSCTLLLIDN
jgi:hypothetical protein